MLQREPEEGESQTDIIILTHLTIEKNMNAAIARVESLDSAVLLYRLYLMAFVRMNLCCLSIKPT